MRRITRDDVTKAVSRVDDITIAQIIGTGATVDELAEAQAWLANDEPMMNTGEPGDRWDSRTRRYSHGVQTRRG